MINFVAGNHIELLRNGTAFFPALAKAITQAKQSVYLQSYIFESDAAGIQIADALKAAAQRGVIVRVLLDGFGCKNMPRDFVKALKQAGVQIMFYRPKVSPWTLKKNRLRRLHRKIAVIDNQIGFVGGINIIDDNNVPNNMPPRLDYAVKVEGALVPSMTESAQKLWRRIAITHLKSPNVGKSKSLLNTQKSIKKGVKAAFVLRDNLLHRRDIEKAYLTAIHAAKFEIIIANAYFIPGRRFRQALIKAAKRGVKIELLLQGRMEYFLMFATHAFYSVFLKNNIEIFEYRQSFMHCKVAVIDSYWATVGSSNIDPFSMMLAREANIVVQDSAFASELRTEIIASIRNNAYQVSADEWTKSSLTKRCISWFVYALVRGFLGLIGYSNER